MLWLLVAWWFGTASRNWVPGLVHPKRFLALGFENENFQLAATWGLNLRSRLLAFTLSFLRFLHCYCHVRYPLFPYDPSSTHALCQSPRLSSLLLSVAWRSSHAYFCFTIARCVLYIYHSTLVFESYNTPFSDSVRTPTPVVHQHGHGMFARAFGRGLVDTITFTLKLNSIHTESYSTSHCLCLRKLHHLTTRSGARTERLSQASLCSSSNIRPTWGR